MNAAAKPREGRAMRLSVAGLSKSYSGVPVLHGVDFDVRVGEVAALVGENGAGKSTLVKMLAGIYPPDGGSLVIDGEPLRCITPPTRQAVASR